MHIWGITHHGVVRQQNQDAFDILELGPECGLALVCDGMGGARAGNVASTMAVSCFVKKFRETQTDRPVRERMQLAATYANQQVFSCSAREPEYAGMGTTIVAAYAENDEAVILNEGDSRAYHINRQGIALITRDHSLVEDMVERGELTREEARNHPHKNLITRALGAEPVLMADCFQQSFLPGDFLLLCSDGLSNIVAEQEILYEVIHGGEPESACRRLLDIALERGAPDNVSVVLIQR